MEKLSSSSISMMDDVISDTPFVEIDETFKSVPSLGMIMPKWPRPRTKVYGWMNATYYESMSPMSCCICGKKIPDHRIDMPKESVDEFVREHPDVKIKRHDHGDADVCSDCCVKYGIETVWTPISNYTGD